MACSKGDATVSAMVSGVAPGYVARTTIVGGTTSGYSLIGSLNIAKRPITKIAMDNTPAKIGRLMKKSEKFMVLPLVFLADNYRIAVFNSDGRAAVASSGVTSIPVRTRCRPLTTISSPGCRPDSMTRSPSMAGPRSTV